MGSYRLTAKSLHLNRILDFTRVILETVKKSLHHSCTSSIKWQGISLPLDRQSYSRRLLRIKKYIFYYKKHILLYLKVPGRCQIQYFIIAILQNPVFLINSRFFHVSDLLNKLFVQKTPSSEVTELICRVPSISFT